MYFSDPKELRKSGIDLEKAKKPNRRMGGVLGGCTEPPEYGCSSVVKTYEEGVSNGDLILYDDDELAERLMYQERFNSTLQHRIDADWMHRITQGRLGWCWCYTVIAMMMAAAARDGKPYNRLSAAWVAYQVKNGRDVGGWPIEAVEFIVEHGVPDWELMKDCNCSGSRCKGPRGGCEALDGSKIEPARDDAKQIIIGKFYELPRDKETSRRAILSALVDQHPVGAGWINTGAWCDGHAMCLTRAVRLENSRARGTLGEWSMIPENSWGDYMRRKAVSQTPTGGVILVTNEYDK